MVNEVQHNIPIAKYSLGHKHITLLVENWLIERNINRDDLKKEVGNDRLYDLLLALEAGNY